MKLSNEENLAHYEQTYARRSLRPSKDFIPQTRMMFRAFAPAMLRNPSAYRLLDLGGGTGEFSQMLADMGFSVTCFDFSATAIAKARSLGLATIQGDFYTYPFVPTYHIVFARGFSCFNIDSAVEFSMLARRAGQALLPGGIGLYSALTDLSGEWTTSNWYNLSGRDLLEYFGRWQFLLFPFPFFNRVPRRNYQILIPPFVHRVLSSCICRLGARKLPRQVRVLARLPTTQPVAP